MRFKAVFNLILLIGIIFISSESLSAQPNLKEPDRKKDFGWSLRKFEKKGKEASKNKETAQKSPKQSESTDSETIRVETNLVINDLLVVNEKGNAILGLKESDFIITEDTEPQKVELFSFGDNAALPRSIVLILRSIPSRAANTLDWMKINSEATKVLVDKLTPNDKMAIVTSEQKLALDFTRDKILLKKTIDRVSSNPNAKPHVWRDYGALMAVLDEMFDEKDVRPIVIFQTGGIELSFLKGEFPNLPQGVQDVWKSDRQRYEQQYGGERGYSLNDVLERVEKSRATVYSIYLSLQIAGLPREEQLKRARIEIEEMWRNGLKGEDSARASAEAAADRYQSGEVEFLVFLQTALMRTAKLSGGYTEFVEKPEEAQRAYETIFTVINNRYTIGYYSTNQKKDGKRRIVKVAVRGHPEYVIVGKESYLSSEGAK